jgi:N-acetylmuramoyl-L-alanine amidase
VPLAALCGLGTAACGASDLSPTGVAAAESRPAPRADSAATGGTAHAESVGTATAETRPTTKARATAEPLTGKTIVIDPGHNGGNYRHPEVINKQVDVLTKRKACDTTGTSTNSGYSEAAFTWDVSRRLAKLLKAEGATVKLTRSGNDGVGPCITKRAAIGNHADADAAISIHADGAPPKDHGFHVIVPKKINGPVDPVVRKSEKLGIAIRDAYHAGTGLPYSTYIGHKGLDHRNDLGGLNLSTVPKVFLEAGNMRNPQEAAKFKSAAFRQRIAESLAKGFRDYLT